MSECLFEYTHIMFSESYVADTRKKQPSEAALLKQQQLEAKCQAYEHAFDNVPLPSKRKKRASVAGLLQKERKPTKLQQMRDQLQ